LPTLVLSNSWLLFRRVWNRFCRCWAHDPARIYCGSSSIMGPVFGSMFACIAMGAILRNSIRTTSLWAILGHRHESLSTTFGTVPMLFQATWSWRHRKVPIENGPCLEQWFIYIARVRFLEQVSRQHCFWNDFWDQLQRISISGTVPVDSRQFWIWIDSAWFSLSRRVEVVRPIFGGDLLAVTASRRADF
jgi:hypothetical protein